jgi:4-hydroxy-tetrahydrodipicolinate synthase
VLEGARRAEVIAMVEKAAATRPDLTPTAPAALTEA